MNNQQLIDDDGDVVIFDIRPNQLAFYKRTDLRGWEHWFSFVPDQKGRFWVWTMKPVGRGAKTNRAKEFVMVRPRWFRIRRKAKAWMLKRSGLFQKGLHL